jgi:glycosyltransferase involved in cell wall biosynthesis
MKIGFDAKRAYHNTTGLGHYSRMLISGLARYFPEHEYYLFNPKPSAFYKPEGAHVHEILPTSTLGKLFRSAWRSSWVKKDLLKHHLNIYHGLSHEIPLGIQKTAVKSVVTIHDLIFEKYPEQYNAVDVKIYRKKFQYACKHADRVVAISQQTRRDIMELYGTPEAKIEVIMQSCNPAFAARLGSDEKKRVREKYKLPEKYFLYVGSIIERKNLLTICKGLNMIKDKTHLPLVVIGEGGPYKQKVQEYIKAQHLENRVIFLSASAEAKASPGFKSAKDFPAIYQGATAMIYPSVYEGFGLPVLEALWSRLPVITSNVSCLPETGGDAAFYIDPFDEEQMAHALLETLNNTQLRLEMIDKGWQHAHQFAPEKYIASMMMLYNGLMR